MTISLLNKLRLLIGAKRRTEILSFTINLTPAQEAAEHEMQDRIMAFVEQDLRDSKFVYDEKLPGLIRHIRSKLFPYGRLSILAVFDIGDRLAADKKFFRRTAFRQMEPEKFVEDICIRAYRRARGEEPAMPECRQDLAA